MPAISPLASISTSRAVTSAIPDSFFVNDVFIAASLLEKPQSGFFIGTDRQTPSTAG